jgi:hypothetical protein
LIFEGTNRAAFADIPIGGGKAVALAREFS